MIILNELNESFDENNEDVEIEKIEITKEDEEIKVGFELNDDQFYEYLARLHPSKYEVTPSAILKRIEELINKHYEKRQAERVAIAEWVKKNYL